jgi:catechol 2,3-dioxygenase-like lactoylglutathione lyase family enzyme
VAGNQEQPARPGGWPARRIHHVGITVGQLDRSLAFYRDLLGLSVIGISDDEDVAAIVGLPGARARIADLDAGDGQLIELLEYGSASASGRAPGPDAAGGCHLCLQVGDLRSALSRLAGAGFLPMGEPAELSGGVWQDCTAVYLRDPDGVIVELIEKGAGS